jgi:hypothetical protein
VEPYRIGIGADFDMDCIHLHLLYYLVRAPHKKRRKNVQLYMKSLCVSFGVG